MNIVLGATGQVGSRLVDRLLDKGQPVRAVVRSVSKAQPMIAKGARVVEADFNDGEALKKALAGGSTVFLLTPENPTPENYLAEIQAMIWNYRQAVLSAGATKVVGLSSMGAQHASGTGYLLASHLLEQAFADLDIQQIFVRPAYYYSNWLAYLDLVREHGVLPTFFPPGLELPMIAPGDVAEFLADRMISADPQERIYEITGPRAYRSLDIAGAFEQVLGREVALQHILPEEWEATLRQAGFSNDGVRNLIQMTQAVIDGKTSHEQSHPVRCETDFQAYLKNMLRPLKS